MCLKRKKMYEKQVQQLNGTRMTLETQLCAIENQSMNVEMFKAMQMGSNIMKQNTKELYLFVLFLFLFLLLLLFHHVFLDEHFFFFFLSFTNHSCTFTGTSIKSRT